MTNYLSRVDIGFIRPRLLYTKLITKKYADIKRGFVHELGQIPEDIPVDSIIYLLFLWNRNFSKIFWQEFQVCNFNTTLEALYQLKIIPFIAELSLLYGIK